MWTKVLPKCKYCGWDVTEIGTVVDYWVWEYRCNSVCKWYFNAEFYMSTQDVLLETTLETTSS